MRALRALLMFTVFVALAACTEDRVTAPAGSSLQSAAAAVEDGLSPMEQLGKSIYFDTNLSLNRNQSCASCHAPEAGFAAPAAGSPFEQRGSVVEGSVDGRFGNRKPPSAAYATLSPILHYDMAEGLFIGGNFWNGRATGELLGNPAADQALGPFLNPAEQGLSDKACVVYRVCTGDYPVAMDAVFSGACTINWPDNTDATCENEGETVALTDADRASVDAAYNQVGLAVAAFEGSSEVNAYTSKYDAYLAGAAKLTPQEHLGLALFRSMKAKCAACHILDEGPNGEPPLFTDFTFDNLGIPINPENPAYIAVGFTDQGLGEFLETRPEWAVLASENYGKHKVPTLRNLDKRPYPGFLRTYGHNGYFQSLEGIVHFYNTRDVKPTCPGPYTEAEALAADCWPAPEVAANVNTAELGDLSLKPEHEAAIVAFLKTLNDGYMR